MNHEDIYIHFEYDGIDFNIKTKSGKLQGSKWIPNNITPEFIIIYIHDYGSFITHNHDIIDEFVSKGGIFYSCDHLGHGRSPGSRLSLVVDDVIDEIDELIHLSKEEYPNLPIYLMGKTFGSLCILKYILNLPIELTNLNGIILETPWLSRWEKNHIGIFETLWLLFLNLISPNFILNRGFIEFDNDVCLKFQNLSENCSLYFPYITPILYFSILETIQFVRNDLDKYPITLPTLILNSLKDNIIDQYEISSFLKETFELNNNFFIKDYNCSHYITKTFLRNEYFQDCYIFIKKYCLKT